LLHSSVQVDQPLSNIVKFPDYVQHFCLCIMPALLVLMSLIKCWQRWRSQWLYNDKSIKPVASQPQQHYNGNMVKFTHLPVPISTT